MDYFACPRNFTLNIVPDIGENVLWKKDGNEVAVTVLEDRGTRYMVEEEDGTKEEVHKSSIIKLGGVIPVNVVTFQDGAEVFHGNVSYLNAMSIHIIHFLLFRDKTAIF